MRRRLLQPLLLTLLLGATSAWAQGPDRAAPRPMFGTNSLLAITCGAAGFNCEERDQTFFILVAGTIAFAVLSLLGVIFTALIVYGGYRWMLARGDESKITEAKGIIRHAIIGLAITLAAYSVWRVIAAIL